MTEHENLMIEKSIDKRLEERIGNAIVVVFVVAVVAVLMAVLALPAFLANKLTDLRWLTAYPALLVAFMVWVAACGHK